MAQLVTRCPLTGHYMIMRIDVDADRFAAFPEPFARRFCPYCCCEHDWYKKDSKLIDRRPVSRPEIVKVL
jgi:hypothetical protein